MIVATIQEVNEISLGCCACPWPECPEPRKECESMSASASCADDDYTDALTEWEEGLAAWLAAPQIEWLAGRAAWLAADPEREPEDYPTAMPEARDPGDYDIGEPEMPAGYEDVTHGCYAPFIQPAGELTDDLPAIYREMEHVADERTLTGEIRHYVARSGSLGQLSFNSFFSQSASGSVVTSVEIGRVYDYGVNVGAEGGWEVREFEPGTAEAASFDEPPPPFEWIVDQLEPEPCTETTRTSITGARHAEDGGSATDVPTLEITEDPEGDDWPTGWEDANDWAWSNVTEKTEDRTTLKSSVSKSQVISRALAKLPTEWPEVPEGGSCLASVVATWPTIGELMPWLECHSEDQPQSPTGSVVVTKIRYRVGIPDTDGYAGYDDAHAAWLIAHAAWLALPPDDRGPEPREPIQRSTYACQWDEVFFPSGHDDTIDDPEVTPPVPLPDGWQHPQIPDPAASPPSLVHSRDWTWGGSLEDPWSEWFEISLPSEPGETRVVNMLVKCWKSTRHGVKPTSHGEIYPLEEP